MLRLLSCPFYLAFTSTSTNSDVFFRPALLVLVLSRCVYIGTFRTKWKVHRLDSSNRLSPTTNRQNRIGNKIKNRTDVCIPGIWVLEEKTVSFLCYACWVVHFVSSLLPSRQIQKSSSSAGASCPSALRLHVHRNISYQMKSRSPWFIQSAITYHEQAK